MTMRLPIVDCQNLIEFYQAFEQHKNMTSSINYNSNRNNKKSNSNSINPLHHPFCEESPFAVIDIFMPIIIIGALGFLIIPYINTIYYQSVEIVPIVFEEMIAYVVSLIAACSGVIASIAAWELLEAKSRKCGKSNCKGLLKAIEFDIQLESEECVKQLLLKKTDGYGLKQLELGKDHKELESELKKMAPINGRTVLVF